MLYRVLSLTIRSTWSAVEAVGSRNSFTRRSLRSRTALPSTSNTSRNSTYWSAPISLTSRKSDVSSRCAMPVSPPEPERRAPRRGPDVLDVVLLGNDPGQLAVELDDVSAGAVEDCGKGLLLPRPARPTTRPRRRQPIAPEGDSQPHQLTNSPIHQLVPESLIVLPESTPVKLESPS